MIVSIIGYLGDVPVAREKDEEFIWSTVVELGTALLVIVVNDIRTVLAVGCTGIVVDDAETLHALDDILEINMMVVAFRTALLQRIVLAILYADGE